MRRWALALVAGLLAAAPSMGQAVAPAPSDWRPVDAANTLVIDTNQGRIIVELYPQVAPDSVARIEGLVRQHFYDGLTFFRVVDSFMDQTGDPQNTGAGASSLPNLKAEFEFKHTPGAVVAEVAPIPEGAIGFVGALPVVTQPAAMGALTVDGQVRAFGLFCRGVIGMARAQDEDSANSQFFLMRDDKFELNQKYTPFGRVIQGEGVVRAIKVGEPVPDPQDRMLTVQVLADMPPATRPNLEVLDTASAYFKAEAAGGRRSQGDNFNPCALDVAVKPG